MIEFYKEKIKANLELLKIVASGVTVCALIAGNFAVKNDFVDSNLPFIMLTFLVMMILVGLIICFQLYYTINSNLNKIDEHQRLHQP